MNENPKTVACHGDYPGQDEIRDAAVRVMRRCDHLASCSEDANRLTRTFCCDAMQKAHDHLRRWMRDAGMSTRLDALGNLVGRYAGKQGDGHVFMIGSHLDTVVNAGKFDGVLGVLMGVAVAELLQEAKVDLPYALDIVGFSEEEGVRFNTSFLGSRAISGTYDEQLFQLTDAKGVSVREALIDFGARPEEISAAAYSPETLIGFLEPHIEQGPVLEQQNMAAGIVSSISGQTRAEFQFSGTSGHAGTLPHALRHDALAAAAEFITKVETLGQSTQGLFATVGDIAVQPNVSNVIAGKAQVQLDSRHERDDIRLEAFAQIQEFAAHCGARRGVAASVVRCQQQPSVPMNSDMMDHLEAACNEAGVASRRLVSGAGHDAMMMAPLVPTGILFVRCAGGVSHHPDESVDVSDVQTALDILFRFLIRLEGKVGDRTN